MYDVDRAVKIIRIIFLIAFLSLLATFGLLCSGCQLDIEDDLTEKNDLTEKVDSSMPKLIIDSASYDSVYVPENGEPADATDVETNTVQPLANRCAYLKDQIERAIFAGKVSTANTYGGANPDPLVFTERYDPLSAFAVGGSGGVGLPAIAWYRVDLFLKANKSSTSGLQILLTDADLVDHNLYSDTGNSGTIWIAHSGIYRLGPNFSPTVWYTGTLTASSDSSVIITQLPDYP